MNDIPMEEQPVLPDGGWVVDDDGTNTPSTAQAQEGEGALRFTQPPSPGAFAGAFPGLPKMADVVAEQSKEHSPDIAFRQAPAARRTSVYM